MERPAHRSRGKLRSTDCAMAPLSPPRQQSSLCLCCCSAWPGQGLTVSWGPQGHVGPSWAPQSARSPRSVPARGMCVCSANAPECFSPLPRKGSPREHRPDANAKRGRCTCFAWLSLRLCFDSDPAAAGQGAGHVCCAGQHVVPGVFRAGDEGSGLSVQQPDRYRGSLGKVGFASEI